MKKGFTLVELSIVLVIIGLLIGGILVARSMIGTAKITRTLTEIGQLDIAISNFQTKYNSLPGDSKTFGTGNGNGYIEDTFLSPMTILRFNNEAAEFWTVLNQSGYDPRRSYSATITGSFNGPNSANSALSSLCTKCSITLYTHPFYNGLYYYKIADHGFITNADQNIFHSNIPASTYVADNPTRESIMALVAKLSGSMTTNVGIAQGRLDISTTALDYCLPAYPKCSAFVQMFSNIGQ